MCVKGAVLIWPENEALYYPTQQRDGGSGRVGFLHADLPIYFNIDVKHPSPEGRE